MDIAFVVIEDVLADRQVRYEQAKLLGMKSRQRRLTTYLDPELVLQDRPLPGEQEGMAARFWRFLERARPRCEDPRWGAYRETLYRETMEVYLRLREIEVQGMRYWATIIAKVSVYPRFEGKGHFSMFLDVVRTLNPGEATCLECVLNLQLRAWCRGHGWIEEPKEHEPFTNPSFYWIKPGGAGDWECRGVVCGPGGERQEGIELGYLDVASIATL